MRRVVEAIAVYPKRDDLSRNYQELDPENVRRALAFAAADLEDTATESNAAGKSGVRRIRFDLTDLRSRFPELPLRLLAKGGFVGASGAPEASSLNPANPLRLLCGQYTRSGLFLPCRQGARCGLFDEVSDSLRLRYIHGVAALDFDNR